MRIVDILDGFCAWVTIQITKTLNARAKFLINILDQSSYLKVSASVYSEVAE
jgi:hypothetical protein